MKENATAQRRVSRNKHLPVKDPVVFSALIWRRRWTLLKQMLFNKTLGKPALNLLYIT